MTTHTDSMARPKRTYGAPVARPERPRVPAQQRVLGALTAVLLGGGGLLLAVDWLAQRPPLGLALTMVAAGWSALLAWLVVGGLRRR